MMSLQIKSLFTIIFGMIIIQWADAFHLLTLGNQLAVAKLIVIQTPSYKYFQLIEQLSKCEPKLKNLKCISSAYSVNEEFNSVQVNLSNSNANRKFTYKVAHFFHIDMEFPRVLSFFIHQNTDGLPKGYLGGTSFDIVVHINDLLFTCSTFDHFNGTYQIFCDLYEYVFLPYQLDTIRVNIAVAYEYFNAFSDSLSKYSVRYLCDECELRKNNHTVNDQKIKLITPVHATNYNYYTGYWQRNSSYDNNTATAASIPRFPFFPKLQNTVFVDQYNYQWHGLYFSSTRHHTNHQQQHQLHTSHIAPLNNFHPIDNCYHHNNTMTTYFIGSSHMRYLFDRILLANFYHNIILLPTKHNSSSVGNFHFLSSVFAEDQSNMLRSLCSNHSTVGAPFNIVFQTGAWDLSIYSIRYFLRNDMVAPALMNTVEGILNGTIPCGNLARFIWITAFPYPILCPPKRYCKPEYKGKRTTAATSAMNEYYLNRLVSIDVLPRIEFSILDSFPMITPRLFSLLVDEEVLCTNHYICSLFPTGYRTTPAGEAIMIATLHALCKP